MEYYFIFLCIITLYFSNSENIIMNPILLNYESNPFVLSFDDIYYYVITSKEILKVGKDNGEINDRKNINTYNKKFICSSYSQKNKYIFWNNHFYDINHPDFGKFTESVNQINFDSDYLTLADLGIDYPGQSNQEIIEFIGIIEYDDNIAVYGKYEKYLFFSSKSYSDFSQFEFENKIEKISCKSTYNNILFCGIILTNNIKLLLLEYQDSQKNIMEYSVKITLKSQSDKPLTNIAIYDIPGKNDIKIVCAHIADHLIKCLTLQIIITNREIIEIKEDENIIFESEYFSENNCYLSKSSYEYEYLFCCAKKDYIECYGLNDDIRIRKKFKLSIGGKNTDLTIIDNDSHIDLFYMNEDENKKTYVYVYYIYFPKCQKESYVIFNSLNENKNEDDYEKLNKLFKVQTNRFYFELMNIPGDIGCLIIDDKEMSSTNSKMEIDSNDKNIDFKSNYLVNEEIIIKYNISVEEEVAYSTICEINIKIESCYDSCNRCSIDKKSSNEKAHNCLEGSCKKNYYQSPINKTNCYTEKEKEINWYFDRDSLKFSVCHENCQSCDGPRENQCLSCKDEYYLNNNNECKIGCSIGQFKKEKSEGTHDCINCYENCRTCNGEGNSYNMSCLSCNTNYIKYNQNCYLINNINLGTFYDPDDNMKITNCYEKYGLYIKENSYECIPFPENGYYISNNETGLLSECYEPCLNCISGKSTNENK